ncbi:MAG: discoidin domain-containing protein [Bacteroidetes bacterium]|nr:discoidin domain-containing protein [Bacteroidota bacterium]
MKNIFLLVCFFSLHLFSQTNSVTLDNGRNISAWKPFQSAGVYVVKKQDQSALRFDIDFTRGSGYGGIVRNFDQPLSENYQLSFWMKATVPVNNFEIKLSDDSLGSTIWWQNNKNFSYPAEWKKIILKKRQISFAWGVENKPFPEQLRRLEFVVTAGSGGKGSVWIKDLVLTPIPLPPHPFPEPVVSASSFSGDAKNIFLSEKSWQSQSSANEWLLIDFGYHKEFGAIKLLWQNSLRGLQYKILASNDKKNFDTLYSVINGKGGEALLYTPESEARYLKILLENNSAKKKFILHSLSVISTDSISSPNSYYAALAASSSEGMYPRYFLNQQMYWTVAGVPYDTKEALLSEDGSVEVDKQQFSLEPFIYSENKILNWANGTIEQSLEDNYLPIPSVTRNYEKLQLSVTLLARGEADASSIMVRYVVKNISPQKQTGLFSLALRPFQVNPSSQWLNIEGGFARTEKIRLYNDSAKAGDKTVIVSSARHSSGGAAIDEGDISEFLSRGELPAEKNIFNTRGMCSAAFQFPFSIEAEDSALFIAAVPFRQKGNLWRALLPTAEQFEKELHSMKKFWKSKLNTVKFSLPKEAERYLDILRSTLAYILINKDNNGFQPGSRSYERSWIRDGSMTSDALLKLGITDEPKKFIDWYSSYQYENGMVPCVVDTRGPDPVPENDSHGELIFAVMEYFRFTGDTAFLRQHWKNISGAARYIQSLRAQRMTEEYKNANDERKRFYGLVTESISHEGYSDKPRHSYWDNFFALKGLNDAAEAAHILNKRKEANYYDSVVLDYRKDLYASIEKTMNDKQVQYIPGCAELGDFDPTSTSIALYPAGEKDFLPAKALRFTFDKYFEWFQSRASGEIPWDVYTPYEIRSVGTYLYLGQKKRALTLLEWFVKDQRPQRWNHWAEVVSHHLRQPRFIGDMPHTWVGSDYINAVRAMFVYENDNDRSLVIASGLKDEWLGEGVTVENLPTHYGTISYSISSAGDSVFLQISGKINSGTKILFPTASSSLQNRKVFYNGKELLNDTMFITITSLPFSVTVIYR